MVYGLLVAGFIFLCFMLITIILLQKSKSSMGLGGLGGSTQMLFGGSGGQDLFQKITWILVALFMIGSLTLTIMKTSQTYNMRSSSDIESQMPAQQMPEMPE